MWICSNCRHLETSAEKPERCPVCGAGADRLTAHTVTGVKGSRTLKNLQDGFVAESKAHQRNLAFAKKGDQEGYPQIARLFRAVAEAEGVHAYNFLRLLGALFDTQENLRAAFERENLASDSYPRFVREANEEGNDSVARMFSFVRDAERSHTKLYEKALEHMASEVDVDYYVCGVCGYVSDSALPDECPVCGASKEKFRRVA